MDKVINLLGGKKNGSDRTGIFDVPTLLKNLIAALVAFGSLTFTAGAYFSNSKDVPVRVSAVERRQDRMEPTLEAILANQSAMAADIRELRAAMLGRGR